MSWRSSNNTGAGDQDWFSTPLQPGGWHTAFIEWSPNLALFRFDGFEIGRTSVRVPNTAMHWVLQTETAIHLTAPPAASARGNVQIDWAAVWAFDPSTAVTTAPITAISAPITGSNVSSITTISATASDNKGVVEHGAEHFGNAHPDGGRARRCRQPDHLDLGRRDGRQRR